MAARLGAAHAELVQQVGEGHRVAKVALAADFSNNSYFNRCFRERFGMGPSDARDGRWRNGADMED